MTTMAVLGSAAGKRLFSSTFCLSDLTDKPFTIYDSMLTHFQGSSSRRVIIVSKKSSRFVPSLPSSRQIQSVKALEELAEAPTPIHTVVGVSSHRLIDRDSNVDVDVEPSLEVLLLLQKSMLEKQWNLQIRQRRTGYLSPGKNGKVEITTSGLSARGRRMSMRRNCLSQTAGSTATTRQKTRISLEFRKYNGAKGSLNGKPSRNLLTHEEVVRLSKIIKAGIALEEHKLRLREKFGIEPSDEQLASSLKISRIELRAKLFECALAREKLTMSNIRLVMSIAQKYNNMGTEMADLIQGGLIGLLRGIEKFDASKGFRFSTYVYWWIRQGIRKTMIENSGVVRVPAHLHERLNSIRNAKIKLQREGIIPSVHTIAESLNISQKKVTNAMKAVKKVISLDRDAFPSLDGLRGEPLQSYIADNKLENNPWYGLERWFLKEEVNKLISSTLAVREQDIIRLYYGLDQQCHTWEDISKQIGLSRERVRQVGLVAMEKLKKEARKRRLETLLVNQY